MHVTRSVKDERGAIMVISAILIPVLLVLTALIVDGGTWFTHKRQLQNRADAGALAAGVEYASVWASCGDPATKTGTAAAIDSAAREYAGDPQMVATVHNTEITDQARVNVEINSIAPHVDPDTSWNDPGGNGLGPCDSHPSGDAFSPAGAQYVDVGVRERDQRSLFGIFGVDLFRNEAHARVQLRTVAAGNGFLPLALPDQDIRQVEVRYYRACSSDNPPVLIGQPITLHTVGAAYQTGSGMTYWSTTFNDENGEQPVGVSLDIPEEKTCTGNYIPIREEVRIAGVEDTVIDVDDYTCSQLVAMQYTDCWSQVSEIRVDKEDPKTEPWFHELRLTGSSGQCSPDPYFARLPVTKPATTSCSYGVSVTVDWNGLATSPPADRQLELKVGGATLTGSGDGVWSGSASNNALGQSTLQLEWKCTDQDPKFPNNPSKRIACPGTSGNWTPVSVRSLFLANRSNAGVLKLVRTSQNGQGAGGQPGPPIDWVPAPQNATGDPEPITIYPTVGLESGLYIGQRRVLRSPHCKGNTNSNNCDVNTASPGTSQSIDCEPGGGTGGQGHDFVMFANGCQPWYDTNYFTDSTWWNSALQKCPDKPNGQSAPWFPNDQSHPRRCVVKAPGFSPNVIASGIAAAIGNCTPNGNKDDANSCNPGTFQCNNPNYYDPTKPKQWALNGGEPSPRVVFIFIVPYGAYKDTSSQDVMPILTFAAFYVTGWEGQGSGKDNPCTTDPDGPGPGRPDEGTEDEDGTSGDIVGYFVDYTMPDAPGDPHSVCVIGQLKPCTPELVR